MNTCILCMYNKETTSLKAKCFPSIIHKGIIKVTIQIIVSTLSIYNLLIIIIFISLQLLQT